MRGEYGFALNMGWGGGGAVWYQQRGGGSMRGGFTLIKEVVGIGNMATLLAWKSV